MTVLLEARRSAARARAWRGRRGSCRARRAAARRRRRRTARRAPGACARRPTASPPGGRRARRTPRGRSAGRRRPTGPRARSRPSSDQSPIAVPSAMPASSSPPSSARSAASIRSPGGAQRAPGASDSSSSRTVRVSPAGADVLGHEADAAADRDLALLGLQLAGQDAQQRALADAVGADERHVVAGRDAERHALEQQVAARVRVGEVRADDVAHLGREPLLRAGAGLARPRPRGPCGGAVVTSESSSARRSRSRPRRRPVERGLVGLRRLGRPADLAHVLQRRGVRPRPSVAGGSKLWRVLMLRHMPPA